MINRRTTLASLLAVPVIPLLAQDNELKVGLAQSELIYLTPIKSDGNESKCKSEIWFYFEDSHVYVVTQTDAWRAEAVRQGLTETRIWVGGSNRRLAVEQKLDTVRSVMATGELITDSSMHVPTVAKFGTKYAAQGVEWSVWGPRWTNSLADGSRVLLKYNLKVS